MNLTYKVNMWEIKTLKPDKNGKRRPRPYGVRWITSTEDAFSRFEQWCAEDEACALHGQDVSMVFSAVAAD